MTFPLRRQFKILENDTEADRHSFGENSSAIASDESMSWEDEVNLIQQ